MPPSFPVFRVYDDDLLVSHKHPSQASTACSSSLTCCHRQARRIRKENGEEWHSLWFNYQGAAGAKDLTSTTEQGFSWAFNDDYWKKQPSRDWNGYADIY